MDILYSAIIRRGQALAERSLRDNRRHNGVDLRLLAIAIADQAKPGEKVCVSASRLMGYYFHQDSSDLVIVTIGEESTPRRVLLQLLMAVDAKLKSKAGDYSNVLDKALSDVAANRDNIQLAQSEINDVKQVLINNVDLLLERGERINLLVDRTSDMSQSANIFNRQATHLQRRMWFQNVKLMLVGTALLAGAGFVIIKTL